MMKNISLNIMVLLFILSAIPMASGEPDSSRDRAFVVDFLSSLENGTVSSAASGLDIPIKCGTPIAEAARDMRNEIDPALYKSLFVRPDLQTYLNTDHFRIHYDTTGVDAPTDPDYVDSVAVIFEYVWNYELNDLDYSSILDYGRPLPDGGAGGDSRYDIYLRNIGPDNLYGITYPEGNAGDRRVPSYIVVDNNYTDPIFIQLGYGGRPLEALKVTAAHEFFHSIHFSLDAFEGGSTPGLPYLRYWWQEATAVWMENKAYTEVNDYLISLHYFFDFPWVSLESYKLPSSGDNIRAMHPYASCVWPMFLDEDYDQDVIRQIWDICGQVEGYNVLPATQQVLSGGFGTSFDAAWQEFLIWNYFTGSRADTLNRYSESNLWADTLKPIVYYDGDWFQNVPRDYSFTSSNFTPEELGSNYLIFDKSFIFEQGGMRFQFDGDSIFDPRNVWRGQILGWDRSQDSVVHVDITPPENTGEGIFRGWQIYDRIIYIPAIFGYYYQQQSTGYSLSAVFDSLLTNDAPFFYEIPRTVEVRAGSTLRLDIFAHDPNGDSLSFSIEPDTLTDLNLTPLSDTSAILEYRPSHDLIDSTVSVDLYVEDPDGHYDIRSVNFKVVFFSAGTEIALVGYPNPFSYSTNGHITLRFTLPDSTAAGKVELFVFDVAGELVFNKEFSDLQELAPGETTFIWDGKNRNGKELASGIYILKLRADKNSADGKIAIIR